MISANKLTRELRKRYPTAKHALRKLGIDEDLLNNAGSGGNGDKRMRALRFALEALLSDIQNTLPDGAISKILALLDDHVDLEAASVDDPQYEGIQRIRGRDTYEKSAKKADEDSAGRDEFERSAAEANENSEGEDENDDEERIEKLREFLREHGVGDDAETLDGAIDLVRKIVKDKKRGHDNGLPNHALKGGFGGALSRSMSRGGLGLDSLGKLRPDLIGAERLSAKRDVSVGRGFTARHPDVARVF